MKEPTPTEVDGQIAAFVLGSFLTSYPGEDLAAAVGPLLQTIDASEQDSSLHEAWKAVRQQVEARVLNPESDLNDLRSEYIDLFDKGKSENPIHETEFGPARTLRKTHELADLAGFYQAFGMALEHSEQLPEMPDHVAVELEFYATLMVKSAVLEAEGNDEGTSVVMDARRKFLTDHLGRFVGLIREGRGVRQSAFYLAVCHWLAVLVANECNGLGATPELTNWYDSQSESEDLCCGIKPEKAIAAP